MCVLNIEIKRWRGLGWELGPGVEMIAFLFYFIGDSSNTHTHVQTHTHTLKQVFSRLFKYFIFFQIQLKRKLK